jgi:uncharacterized protein YdhG (YjbR/CyaY superfamily)
MATATTVDEYLAGLPPDRAAYMEQLRQTIRVVAPEAHEVISYAMPAFKTHGQFLVSFDAFKAHYSLFPATDVMIQELGDEIAPYLSGRGTIRFPADQLLPVELVRQIVAIRVRENEERAAAAGRG